MSKIVNNQTHQDDESESFYSRWSKRKTQERSNQLLEKQPDLATDNNSTLEPTIENSISPELNQEKVLLCDQDMPDIDTLDEDSDYSGFLSPGVSEELRKLALRKLFHGQHFNLCDGLDDYDEEFTSFEKLGDIVTADMRFQLEEEAKRKLQMASEEDDIPADSDEVAIMNSVYAEDDTNESIAAAMADDPADSDEENRNNNEEAEMRDNDNLS